MDFPICFKYPDHKTWIRINASDEFEEIQIIGKKYHHHVIQAIQYPEKLKIRDMINNKHQYLISISNQEFEKFWRRTKEEKTEIGGQL